MTKTNVVLKKIKKAKGEIEVAAGELEKIIGALRVLPRAEKTTATKVVEQAFVKLNAAKTNLTELEAMLTEKA